MKMRILMVAAECAPLVKVGGLADVVSGLSAALADQGHAVDICLPLTPRAPGWPPGGLRAGERLEVELPPPLGRKLAVHVHPVPSGRLLLVEEPELFDRPGVYGDPKTGAGYADNTERYAVFSAVAAHLAARGAAGPPPDVVHGHDHPAGLLPAFLRHGPPGLRAERPVPVVFTIHNLAHQGIAEPELAAKLGLEPGLMAPMGPLEFHGDMNPMKVALFLADRITTVSCGYAGEIRHAAFGEGLEGVLEHRHRRLHGILNGVDTECWDPARDPLIPHPYSVKRMGGKSRNRSALVKSLDLEPAGPETPVLGVISRLAAQKGIDWLLQSVDELLAMDVRLVVLGAGEEALARGLQAAASRHRGRMAVRIGFDEPLAHQIEAGSDMFLMPSRYEPCGLNQMYSLRYGTVPVVRATGGLADTVIDVDEDPRRGNGFVFRAPLAVELVKTVRRAVRLFRDGPAWHALMLRGMGTDFSWTTPARQYVKVYEAARADARSAGASAATPTSRPEGGGGR
jgi:starch synthase